MYQNVASEMQSGFKPVMHMFDVHNRMAQKMLREQTMFWGDWMNLGTRRAEALRGNQDPSEIFRMTLDASRELGERWVRAAGRQWNILMEARRELSGEVMTVVEQAETSVSAAVDKAQTNVSEATDEARSTTVSAATDEAQSTAAGKSTEK